jgi:hypothetical protein
MVPEIDAADASRATSGAHARACEAYREAARRDPRRFPFGYLPRDPETRAVGAFVWFASPAEMTAFLVGPEVDLLQLEPDEAERIVVWLERALGTTRNVARLDRSAICAGFAGWVEIAWIGTFADLCERGGDFQTAVRADFRSARALGEHGGPVADDELDAFVAWLATGAASL